MHLYTFMEHHKYKLTSSSNQNAQFYHELLSNVIVFKVKHKQVYYILKSIPKFIDLIGFLHHRTQHY